ncbi:MAG: hypothetical protein JSR85_08675 [Proteobacteria bacterium]|nr:hypothetical protein [Pseudomonadota bacterium]
MSIQVMRIFKESFKNVWEHRLEWVKIAFTPVVIFLAGALIMLVSYWSAGQPLWSLDVLTQQVEAQISEENALPIAFGNIVYYIAQLIAMISLYISGFRYAVLNEGGDRWWTLNFNKRFVKMLLYYILIVLLFVAYTGIAAGITLGLHFGLENTTLTAIVGTLLALYGIYLFVRLSLTFLLIAIDHDVPLRTSWRLLKRNVLRLIGLMLLISLAFLAIIAITFLILGIVTWILSLVSPWLFGVGLFLMALAGLVLWLFSFGVILKSLALVYKSFTEGTAF